MYSSVIRLSIYRVIFTDRDGYGRNVLLVAASCGHLEIILYLLKKKERVRIDSTDLESRWSALHRAAYLGYVGILVPLIKNGGNLELLDFDKFSPLNILHYNMETINKMKCKQSNTCTCTCDLLAIISSGDLTHYTLFLIMSIVHCTVYMLVALYLLIPFIIHSYLS